MPNPSTLNVSPLTIGSSSTFHVTSESSSYTHTITYQFHNTTGTVANMSAGATTVAWTPPNTFLNLMPYSVQDQITFTLATKSGGATIGTYNYNTTVSVPSSVTPSNVTISLEPVNTNAWISSQNLYVGGFTKLKVTSSATPGTGASMDRYTVYGAFSGSGSPVISPNVLNAGTQIVNVMAYDTRGRSAGGQNQVTFLQYSAPSLAAFSAVRGTYSNGTWTTNPGGDHIRVTAVPQCSLSAEGNTATVNVKIGYTNPDATSGNYYYFTSTLGSTIYTVNGSVTDDVGQSSTRTLTVPSVEVPFNVDVDLPGVGVGMIAQNARVLDVSPSWELHATGKYKAVGGQFLEDSTYGIDMNNSDIINFNAIFAGGVADSYDEGINFLRQNSNWDKIYAKDGTPYFMPNVPTGGPATTPETILTSGNVADYVTQSYKSGIWRCRIWSSGVRECWGTIPLTISGWTKYGQIYYSNNYAQENYPSNFFASGTYPVISVTGAGKLSVSSVDPYWGNDTSYSVHTPQIYAVRYDNAYTGQVFISVHAYTEVS